MRDDLIMLTGSALHAVVPATVKERSPNLERVRGMSSRWQDDDLRLRPARRDALDTGTQQFMIHTYGIFRVESLEYDKAVCTVRVLAPV